MFKKLSRVIFALLIIFFIITIASAFLKKLFPQTYIEEVRKYCTEFNVEESLVLALIKAESNFNPMAESRAGAKGLMQITEDTFNFCNDSLKKENADVFSPDENIRAGVWYLSYLIKRYDNSTPNALAAYNAGFGNVDKWLNNPTYSPDGKILKFIPFNETRRYVKKSPVIKKFMHFFIKEVCL